MMWAGRFIGKSSKNTNDVGRSVQRVVRIRMMWAGSSKNPDDVGKSVHREE